MEQLGILVPIFMFLGLFTMVIFLRKYENDERMAMIEKGIAPVGNKKSFGIIALRLGLMSIGIGLGILVGFIIISNMGAAENESITGAVYGSTVLIFGGCGLLLSYFIGKKPKNE
jgi:hypothetical protein